MSDDYAYGREQIVYITQEDPYGVLVHPAAADALKVLSCNFTPAQERKDRLEKGSTRSIISRFTGRKSVDWSIEKYVLPSGSKGTPPDDALLWEALFGSEEIHSETSVDYILLAEPAISLSIINNVGPHREAIFGAVPSKFGFKFGGGDEPKVTFSGSAKDHLLCGSDTLDVAASSSAITVHDARQFAVGMVIQVGDDDNSGAGFEITEINYDTNVITLDASATADDESAVVPLPLGATTAGDVIPVISGNVKIGASATVIYITGCSIDIDQKVALRNDEFGYSSARGYRHPEFRDVALSLDLYFEKGAAKWLNDAKRFTSQAVEINLGETDGYKMEIDAGQVEFTIPNIAVPDTGECTITLAGKCLGSSGEDELVMKFL